MKTLAFLLLLDYSGSMYQPLDNRTKIEILKQETQSLMSTAVPESPSLALIFGTKPENSCKDVEVIGATTQKLSQRVQALRPGNQGKTPLALGLRQMVRAAIRYDANMSVVVTDGADSCGEDPCKSLEAADKELTKARKKLRVEIIGFDLKRDSSKFSCFKDLKLQSIQVTMTEAGNSAALAARLKQAQQGLYQTGRALHDADTERILGLQKNVSSKSGRGSGGQGADGKEVDEKEARVEIIGAPATSRFSAHPTQGAARNWQGSYIVTLVPGEYVIRFDDANNGGELKLNLGGGTHTKIPWAKLMKNANCNLELQSPTLALTWTPSDTTKSVHGVLQERKTIATLNPFESRQEKVPFGNWKLEITSPPWLKDRVKPAQIDIYAGASTAVDVEKVFSDQLKWVENPNPNALQVMRLLLSNGSEDRYPIQPGIKRLPIPKSAEVEWILPSANPSP